MFRPNPFQTAAHCWRFALRRALADEDTFHIVMTDNPAAPRAVLSDRAMFARDDLTLEDIETSADPFPVRDEHRRIPAMTIGGPLMHRSTRHRPEVDPDRTATNSRRRNRRVTQCG